MLMPVQPFLNPDRRIIPTRQAETDQGDDAEGEAKSVRVDRHWS
jgi:hypothetical protein